MLAPPTRTRPGRRSGKVLALFALSLVFLTGMVAFSVDVGQIAVARTELQRTADAAALAGVTKLAVRPNQAHDPAAVRAQVRKYVELNAPGLTVRDEDVVLLRHAPAADPGKRFTADFTAGPPNAVRVTVRRDRLANGGVDLAFAPMLGQDTADVNATATAVLDQARGVTPYTPLIPFTMHVDTYAAVTAGTTDGLDADVKKLLSDAWTAPGNGYLIQVPDGVREVQLYGAKNDAPGNFGSLDIGSQANGTPELNRQLAQGPLPVDFADSYFAPKVARDGALYAPFTTTGDPGMSTAVKHGFDPAVGHTRIIPLYRSLTEGGDNATYEIVGFAAVVITDVDFNGNPKKVRVQPTALINHRVTARGPNAGMPMFGVYAPPRLVMP